MKQHILNWVKSVVNLHNNGQNSSPSQFIRVAYCVPHQVVLLTARHESNENVWPIDWHMPLSIDPELYAVSLNPGYGQELIRASGVFVVNFVPASWEEVIFYCGRTSGRHVDKFAGSKLRKSEANMIKAPYLTEALGFMECKVIQEMPVGDHILFIAEVLQATHQPHAARLHHIDGSLSDMAGSFE